MGRPDEPTAAGTRSTGGVRGGAPGPSAARGLVVVGVMWAILGLICGAVESLVRALQHSYYFSTWRSLASFALIPGAAYAAFGFIAGLAVASVVARAGRRPSGLSTAVALGPPLVISIYWGSIFHEPFFSTVGNVVGHIAMVGSALIAFVLARRAAKHVLGAPRSRSNAVLRGALAATPVVLFVVIAGGWALFSTAFGSGVHPGLEGARPSTPMNVLLITIDTLRADRLGCYGYPAERFERGDGLGTSPVIDGLAEGGTLFESAVVPQVVTSPSHASILTSLYPEEHGVTVNAVRLRPDVVSLAEVLRASGYRTAGCVSAEHLNGCSFGMSQGFSDFYDRGFHDRFRHHVGWRSLPRPRREHMFGLTRPGSETTNQALKWLRRGDRRPFFLWIHYFDPHWPYESHEEPQASFGRKELDEVRRSTGSESADLESLAVGLYDSEIHFTDGEIGRLLNALEEAGVIGETLIVLTADHGEHMNEPRLARGLWFGHAEVYEETCRVPLIFWSPGVVPSGVVEDQVSTMDIGPTILDLVGVRDPRDGLAGRSLKGVLNGGPWEEIPLVVVANPHMGVDSWAIRSRGWKLIERRGADPELYDLGTDPAELTNLADVHPRRLGDLRRELARIMRAWRPVTEAELPDPASIEMLRALGYVQ